MGNEIILGQGNNSNLDFRYLNSLSCFTKFICQDQYPMEVTVNSKWVSVWEKNEYKSILRTPWFSFFSLSQNRQPLHNGSEIQSLNHSGVRRHDNMNKFGHLWIFVDTLRFGGLGLRIWIKIWIRIQGSKLEFGDKAFRFKYWVIIKDYSIYVWQMKMQ